VARPAARLEELRWTALERRIDADLASGRHDSLLAELQSLVAQHPLRERLHAQLMLALYRCGRQAEALDAYRRAREILTDELGLEPGDELTRLQRAILQHDPALDVTGTPRTGRARGNPSSAVRPMIVAPGRLASLDALLAVATPLAAERELILATVVAPSALRHASATLAARRDGLLGRGLVARTAAFSSPTPARDLARLAAKESADLLITDLCGAQLDAALLDETPCDVALLVDAGGPPIPRAVVVPFGAAWHDWAALDLGASIALATGASLQLVGAASNDHGDGRDASRLLADASLILQRTAGIAAEPVLTAPGHAGIAVSAHGAGLLIMGLSERWRTEGLGRLRRRIVQEPPAPTLFVRRGPRRGALAPPETATRFGWSLTASPA
jgi:hypothetical protein